MAVITPLLEVIHSRFINKAESVVEYQDMSPGYSAILRLVIFPIGFIILLVRVCTIFVRPRIAFSRHTPDLLNSIFVIF